MNNFAFIFPGQGSYVASCLERIENASPDAAKVAHEVDSVVVPLIGGSLKTVCGSHSAAALSAHNPLALQLALYSAALMIATILDGRGVQPDICMGHSFGEIAALAHAKAFSAADGANIVCARTQALAESAPVDGVMLAVPLSVAQTQETLREHAVSNVVVAVENHPTQTVVSGPREQIEFYSDALRALGLSTKLLTSPYGFHHPNLSAAMQNFGRRLQSYKAERHLRYKVWSPILGRAYEPKDDVLQLLAQHLVLPVRFGTMVQTAFHSGMRVLVECSELDTLGLIAKRALAPVQAKQLQIFSLRVNAKSQQSDSSPTQIINQSLNAIVDVAGKVNMSSETAFERFWRERSPHLLMHIKTEFEYFLASQHIYEKSTNIVVEPASVAAAIHQNSILPRPSLSVVSAQPAQVVHAPLLASAASTAPVAIGHSRSSVFQKLADVYAEAMEYPAEVFTENAELEAELGIDSVKQTEIVGRVIKMFSLPPLPADLRLSEYRTLGQITDLVMSSQDVQLAV